MVVSRTVARPPAARPNRAYAGYELSIGAVAMGAMSFGESDATFSRPTASPLLVFNSDISLGPGPGAEVHFGRPVGSRLAFEVDRHLDVHDDSSEVSTDIENAPDATLTEDLSRFSVEGSALWRLAGGAQRRVLSARRRGWMRELAAGATLAETGVIGNVGVAVKYWWGASSSVQRRRLGLRLDGRAVLRSGGVDLGAERRPAGARRVGGSDDRLLTPQPCHSIHSARVPP